MEMNQKTCNYYVTLRCNDTCEFCSVWQNKDYKKIAEKPYDLSDLKKLDVSKLNITGGEPLLRDDLPQILKQAKEIGLEVSLTTNGILYNERAQWLDKTVDKLFFSLDYPFAEMHDRSRGIECFQIVIEGIKLAQKLGQRPIIKFTMTRDSVQHLPDMVNLAESLNVCLYLNPVYDFYGTQGFEGSTLRYVRYYFQRKSVLLNLAVLEFVKARGNRMLFPRCRAKETTVTVLPDGTQVAPCLYNQGGRQGRENICSSCMRWPYMLPSFSKGIDKYFCLNKYSNFINGRKL
jgi:MoaA/NifB/PqqE/SkfB family radical SAM enzyme